MRSVRRPWQWQQALPSAGALPILQLRCKKSQAEEWDKNIVVDAFRWVSTESIGWFSVDSSFQIQRFCTRSADVWLQRSWTGLPKEFYLVYLPLAVSWWHVNTWAQGNPTRCVMILWYCPLCSYQTAHPHIVTSGLSCWNYPGGELTAGQLTSYFFHATFLGASAPRFRVKIQGCKSVKVSNQKKALRTPGLDFWKKKDKKNFHHSFPSPWWIPGYFTLPRTWAVRSGWLSSRGAFLTQLLAACFKLWMDIW